MQYWWRRRTGWTSGLVERPPGWPKPLMMSGRLYRRLKKSDVPIEGFDVLIKPEPDSTDLIAPQLNGLVLAMRRNGCGPGCGTFFRHIKVGDQPASLFQPDPPE